MRAEAFTAAAARTRGAELRGLVDAMNRLRAQPLDLPSDIPVTAISGALAGSGMSMRVRRAANASHRTRAGRSDRGRHVLARDSGHLVPVTEPDLVATEIQRLLDPHPVA